MTAYRGWTLNHVTEREVAHTWPDGQKDDARWEDCGWCSLVEVLDFAGVELPLTHAEAERLRDASGEPPTGGSNQTDLARGAKARYGITIRQGEGWANLASALTVGTAMAVNGSMGAFPDGSPYRRWDPGFAGSHTVALFKIDTGNPVWCDPLAPDNGYAGERISMAKLEDFVKGFDRRYTVVRFEEFKTGETVNSFVVPKVPTNASIQDNAWLYWSSTLQADSRNKQIDPGPRPMPWHGTFATGVQMVEYVDAAGVHSGRVYFVRDTSITGYAAAQDTTPYSQADIDRLNAQIADLEQQLASADADKQQAVDAAVQQTKDAAHVVMAFE